MVRSTLNVSRNCLNWTKIGFLKPKDSVLTLGLLSLPLKYYFYLFIYKESLGVKAANKAKLFAVISPVGPYFPTGFKPVKMLCNTSYVRASPGGMGEYKVGGNYGPTIKSLKEI